MHLRGEPLTADWYPPDCLYHCLTTNLAQRNLSIIKKEARCLMATCWGNWQASYSLNNMLVYFWTVMVHLSANDLLTVKCYLDLWGTCYSHFLIIVGIEGKLFKFGQTGAFKLKHTQTQNSHYKCTTWTLPTITPPIRNIKNITIIFHVSGKCLLYK